MDATKTSRLGLAALAALALAGCGPAGSGAGESASAQGDTAAIYAATATLFPGAGAARIDVPVCWENPGDAPGTTAAEKAAWRDARRSAVEESWGRMARVNFYGWDGTSPIDAPTRCTSGARALHVVICSLPSDPRCPALPGSQAIPGGYPADFGVDDAIRLNPDHPAWVIVHEFGHALGYYHEEERPDAPATATGSCSKQWWDNSTPATYGSYDPTGIMSYCQPPNAAPWLSPNDVASHQRFYARRVTGSLVSPRANCAASHYARGSGDRFFLWDCDEANRDQQLVDVESPVSDTGRNLQLFGVGSNANPLCMVPGTVTPGAPVQLGDCASSAGWVFWSTSLRGFGGLCLTLPGGMTITGTPIQMARCGASAGAGQRWTLGRDGLIRYGTTSWCARMVDARLQIAACNAGDVQQLFTFDGGRIQRLGSRLCLDVVGPSDAQFTQGLGSPTVGAPVQEFVCNGALNQQWNLDGPIRHAANPGLCLNRAGPDGNSTALTLGACDGSAGQEWDYYF